MSERTHRLLFLHTGGTLGMKGKPGPLEPASYDDTVLPFVRGLEELAEIEHSFLCNIDSSDMEPSVWEGLARTVHEAQGYDGFVVLHGTDTMAYSAAAVALLLQDVEHPVVFTGAQRPIHMLRSDGRSNLIHAAICATLDVPEVGVYFNGQLLRGARTTKFSVNRYDAYRSPGTRALVEMGAEIEYPEPSRRPRGPQRLGSGFERNVTVLTLFPGIQAATLDALVDSGVKGVLLLAFGSGNVPLSGWPDAIGRARRAGVVIVIGSQCVEGSVELGGYAGSDAAMKEGAHSAGDMTLEGALTKLMFVLGQGTLADDFAAAWEQDFAGEAG